jgi:hypothetical protein
MINQDRRYHMALDCAVVLMRVGFTAQQAVNAGDEWYRLTVEQRRSLLKKLEELKVLQDKQ